MTKSFLPEGYEVPKATGGSYMKLKQGPNRFRILSAAITGYEYWTEARKPVRARQVWRTIPADADITGERGWTLSRRVVLPRPRPRGPPRARCCGSRP